ncbi:MAG: hypothetical protein AAF243_04230 [Cyanobacteria bacterium P01_A01_bin.137]
MRLPPSVRYLPSRFQVVLNPWLWLGILLTGVVGVYAWQYRQGSGQLPWQIGATGLGSSGDATSTDVLLESLTPEEQAVAAELDNIELLLAQLDSDVSALTTGGDASAAAALNEALADAPEVSSESSVERLTRYIDEYSFVGTNARGSNPQATRSNGPIPLQREQTPQSTSVEEAQTAAALAESFAARQQQLEQARSANLETEQPASGADVTRAPVTGLPAEAEGGVITDDQSSFVFDQTGVVPGSLDGLNRTFIRTTPNMSPPPGTTGYVPPASLPAFNQANQPSSESPFANPSPGSFGTATPSVELPERSQVLPPAGPSVTTPLELPTRDGSSSSATPNQPRNAWEALWD